MKNCVILLLLFINTLNGAELNDQEKSLKMFVIRGQNCTKIQENLKMESLKISPDKTYQVELPKGMGLNDLGQSNCTEKFKNALTQNNATSFIVHANSEGAAAALGYLSENQEYATKCKGMILESVFVTGNSAAYHMITNNYPWLKKVPGLYYVAPYFAKALFHCYSPKGNQPIDSVKGLNIDGPIIIVHSKHYSQISCNDSRAIYYALQIKNEELQIKNKNIYLICEDTIKSDSKDSADNTEFIVRKILTNQKKIPLSFQNTVHDVLKNTTFNHTDYQPKYEHYQPVYAKCVAKEKIVKEKGLGLSIMTIAIPLLIICGFINKLRNPFALTSTIIPLIILYKKYPAEVKQACNLVRFYARSRAQ